jgi:hypothetical protein
VNILWGATAREPRETFQGTVVRGHFERGGRPNEGLTDVDVEVVKVVSARDLRPDERPADILEYILIGRAQELYVPWLRSVACRSLR